MILNLGCGTKVSASPDVINVDWSVYLRLKRNPLLRRLTPFVVSKVRRQRFESLPDNILVHNLMRPLPFPDNSADAVYHSHVLEHLDRGSAATFLREVRRVLKPDGIHRIVVPDLEQTCRDYLAHITLAEQRVDEATRHDSFVAAIIEQCVRLEALGTSQQTPVRRFIENVVLGNARQQGDMHQWLYDRINLRALLERLGYTHIVVQRFDTSQIPEWDKHGLDVEPGGREYKPGSLYVEARK